MDKGLAGAVSVLLLLLSSSVMVVAWYLHLKFEKWPVWQAVLFSWLIAGMEYCAQVPANRIGVQGAGMTPAHLRAIAEVCVLLAFVVFNTAVLKQPLTWNHIVGFSIVVAGVMVVLFGPFTTAIIPGVSPTPHQDSTGAMAEMDELNVELKEYDDKGR